MVSASGFHGGDRMRLGTQIAKESIKGGIALAKQPMTRRRFNAATRRPGPHKVNIGSGGSRIEGWLNTDVSWRSQMYLDLLHPWRIPQDSVGWIYGDNVIEHFTLAAGRRVLRHAFDALAPGGGIRLVTPDVERVADAYLNNTDLTSRHLDRHARHDYTVAHPVDVLRVVFAECGHHLGYCYDYQALSDELTAAGFKDVHRCEVGHSDDPVFVGVENPKRSEPTSDALTLIVEGRKPEGYEAD
jgi:predicted SAM-dependent methyltransferase